MKLLYFLFLIFLPLESTTDVTTQNILYHSPSRSEKGIGVVTTELNRIFIKGTTKLEWRDGHDQVKYAFDIRSVTGSLSLDNSGEITYQVKSEKVNGRFTVKKINTVIKITAMLVEEGKPLMVDFEVSNFTILD